MNEVKSNVSRAITKDSAIREAANFHHRPYFDGAYAGWRNPLGNGDCFVEIFRVNQVVPAQLFACFCERTVSYEPFALTNAQARCGSHGMKRTGIQIFSR